MPEKTTYPFSGLFATLHDWAATDGAGRYMTSTQKMLPHSQPFLWEWGKLASGAI